jgi:acetate kinase
MDALTFTGGIGEHSAQLRAAAAARLSFLGVAVDAGRNASARTDADISADGALVRTLVVQAGEDLEIARAVTDVLRTQPG